MGCSRSSLERHEWEPQREDPSLGGLARQDIMLTGSVLPLTFTATAERGFLLWVQRPFSMMLHPFGGGGEI